MRADDLARRLLKHPLAGVRCVAAVPNGLALAQRPDPPSTLPCSRCRVLRLFDGSSRTFLLRYDATDEPGVAVRIEPLDWTFGVFDQMAAPGFVLTDEDGTIVHHNRALPRLFGQPSGSLLGQRMAAVAERLASRPGGGENFRAPREGPATVDILRVPRAGGQERNLQIQGTGWTYRDLPCGTMWLALDTTEEVEDRQQAALAIWYRLGAMLEHELRNHLQTIQAAADVIRPALPAGRLRTLDLLEEQVRSISEYVGDLLQAPPSGALTLGRLSDVVDVGISAASARASTRHLSFDHRRLRGEPLVRVDVSSLGRVFAHLFRNSAQARPDATVHVRYAVEGDVLACMVTDDGPGFPNGVVARSLIPGERDAAAHLGLLIVVSTIEAHGGSVTMSNLPRGGASVAIRLPVATRVPSGLRPGSETGAGLRTTAPR